MKILVDALTLEGGGITHLRNLLSTPCFKCLNIVIVGKAKYQKYFLSDNINYIASHNFSRLKYYLIDIHEIIQSYGVTLVYSTNGLYVGHTPTVVICHNFLPFDLFTAMKFYSFKNVLKFVILRLIFFVSYKRSQHLIFLSPFVAAQVTQKLRLRAHSVLPHGLEHVVSKKCDILPSTSKRHRFVYTSSYEPYKNHWLLIEALHRVKKEGYKFSLDLVGPAQPSQLKKILELIISLDLTDEVRVVGVLDPDSLWDLYSKCNTAFFLSECENLPNILLEYIRFQIPVISFSTGPMKSIMRNNSHWIVDTPQVDLIKQKVIQCLDAQLPSFQFFDANDIEYYSWRRVAQDHIRIFTGIDQSKYD